jgi:NADH-quinone oxidoreductase subunit J
MLELLVFLLISAIIIFCSFMVVQSRNIVHGAVYLAGSLLSVAALFILLNAEFIAAIQVLVYVGAVVTLVLFTIMLTRREEAR